MNSNKQVVKILQKDAPYNAYGKTGTVVDIDYEAGEIWLQVQFDKPNQQTPYETWVRERFTTNDGGENNKWE